MATAVFPGALPVVGDFGGEVADLQALTLLGQHVSGGGTTVTATTNIPAEWPAIGWGVIYDANSNTNHEIIRWTGKSGAQLTGVTWAQGVGGGDTGLTHANGETIALRFVAHQYNQIIKEVIALATKVGTGTDTPANGEAFMGTGAGASGWRALTTADIGSGTFADARIAQSNVTQHQAALALAATQLTSGSIPDARVPASNVTQHQAALALAATQLTSGVLPDARVQQSNVTQHQAALALGTGQITSGTFADARIAQSNVTQHQAALAILETQITDGAVLARLGANETITGNWRFNGSVSIGGALPNANWVTGITATGTMSPLGLLGGSGLIEFYKDSTPTRAISFGMAVPGGAISSDFVITTYQQGVGWVERFRAVNIADGGNWAFGGGGSYGSGQGVIFIINRSAAPSGSPVGGGLLYVESGALKYKGSSGTVTNVANA